MDGSGQFGTVVSLVWVREGEKGLGLRVAGSGDKVRSSLAVGRGEGVDCDVDLSGVIRNPRGGNDDARG